MKNVKNLEKVLPYVLLVSYLILCHFRQPQISDSIIIIALASFSGFKSFLNQKEQPDYVEIFKKELESRDRKIQELENSVGVANIAKKRKENLEQLVW